MTSPLLPFVVILHERKGTISAQARNARGRLSTDTEAFDYGRAVPGIVWALDADAAARAGFDRACRLGLVPAERDGTYLARRVYTMPVGSWPPAPETIEVCELRAEMRRTVVAL